MTAGNNVVALSPQHTHNTHELHSKCKKTADAAELGLACVTYNYQLSGCLYLDKARHFHTQMPTILASSLLCLKMIGNQLIQSMQKSVALLLFSSKNVRDAAESEAAQNRQLMPFLCSHVLCNTPHCLAAE